MQLTCNRRSSFLVATLAAALLCPPSAPAGEGPFFITYTHQMEEPGNLELAVKNLVGQPGGGNLFLGGATEFEYGAKAWWTTELYLDGQGTSGQGALFTGYRWENRFRLVPREHWINPVLYVEFENINGADKSLLEVVGNDGKDDLTSPNHEARTEKMREIETKLILSSHYRGWTIAENFIAEKNVRHAPFEFGYAAGISRALAQVARPDRCNLCAENFEAGVEMYGGLGTHHSFGLQNTSHYVAPTLVWNTANGPALRISPGFGLTGTSARFLLRFGVSYEIAQAGRAVRNLFGGSRPMAASLIERVPVGAADSVNPLESDEPALQAGRKLYARECAACHGSHLEGIGKAPPLNQAEVKTAPPGVLFWILRNGSLRRGMPSFAHLPEPQRWQIITFLSSQKTI
jgi:mono/diheme cytochrome c family protein